MEIEHALLKPIHLFLENKGKDYDCPPTKHSIFFFRDDSYIGEITDAQRLIYTNESEVDEEKIKLADEELAKTKEKIRERKVLEDGKSDDDETKVNVLITDYKGHWDKDLKLPELNPVVTEDGVRYNNGENQGRLKTLNVKENH